MKKMYQASLRIWEGFSQAGYSIFQKLKSVRLPLISEYLHIRRKHLTLLRALVYKPASAKEERNLKNLEQYERLSEILLRKIINWYFVLPLFVVIGLVSFGYLLKPNATTHIYASLNVSSVSFQLAQSYHFEASYVDSVNHLGSTLSYNGETTDETGEKHSSETTILKAADGHGIKLETLNITAGSRLSLRRPTASQLHLVVRQSNPKTVLAGSFSLAAGLLLADDVIELPAKEAAETAPYNMAFEKKFTDNVSFDLTMIRPQYLLLPRIYITGPLVFIENNASFDKPVSSILSGSIKLLDTNDDSITLNRDDSLKITFAGKSPVKILLDINPHRVHLEFEAEVEELQAGPGIFHSKKKLDKMPMRIQTLYDKAPYVWAVLIALIPFLATFFFRQRKAI